MFDLNQIRALLPTRCQLCGSASHRPLPLCTGCERDLPWLGEQCLRCAIPMLRTAVCGDCLRHPPPWHRCLSAFEYSNPIDQLIGNYKLKGNLTSGRILGELLMNHLSEQISTRPDRLIPVPLHWRRQFMRGFNQSYNLALMLSRHLDIPCFPRDVRKRLSTTAQRHLPRTERQWNLQGAFEVQGDLSGQHIALVDDVVTTGSTASALAEQLLKSGARQVDVWCIARTPHN